MFCLSRPMKQTTNVNVNGNHLSWLGAIVRPDHAFSVGNSRPLLDRLVALDLDKDSLPKRLVPCSLKSLLDMKDHQIEFRPLEGGKFPSNAQRKHKLDGVRFDHDRSSPASAKPTVLPVLLQR